MSDIQRSINRFGDLVTMFEITNHTEIKAYELEPEYRELTGGGSDSNLELIETFETTLEAYTNTSSWDVVGTGISISDFPYALGLAIVTCDGEITASDWGMTVALVGNNPSTHRFTANSNGQLEFKGNNTFDLSDYTEGFISTGYGVLFESNLGELKFSRKANSSLPTIRGGKYTVKLYGIKSL